MAMKIRLAFVVLAVMVVFAGCQNVIVRDEPLAVRVMPGVHLETAALVEALLSMKGTLVQHVAGSWKEEVFAAEVVVKGDGDRLTVIFLAPQMRLATVTLARPHSIRAECAPQLPRMFAPEYALVDLAFMNLDVQTLAKAIAPTLSVKDDGVKRIVSSREGPIAEVRRNPDGSISFHNLVNGYSCTIIKTSP